MSISYFPDSRIGASLKHRCSQLRAAGVLDFPDSRIGASLKQDVVPLALREGGTSPIRESGPH